MLDQFLEVAYEANKQASFRDEAVAELKKLPNSELMKIASGETKLSFMGGIGVGGGCWLDQFKETPFYQEALALEEQSLEIDIADQQKRMAERGERDSTWDARDAISVKKRMLELELRKSEAGGSGGMDDESEDEEPEEPEATEAVVDKMSAARGAMIIESMRKQAKKDEGVTGKQLVTMAALPVAGAGLGAGMYGLSGLGRSKAAPIATRLARGAGVGGTIGLGAAGLAGMGHLLSKADPSGRGIDTAVKLAPAAAMAYGATRDAEREKDSSASVEDLILSMRKMAELEKEAFVGNALKLVGGAAKYVGSGAKAGLKGMQGVGGAAPTFAQKAKGALTGGAQAFGDVAKTSPMAAAGLAGGALGGAALVGAGAGRVTAPRR